MTEAALFYEQARPGFGDIFIDDIQHAIDTVRERPLLGEEIGYGFRRTFDSPLPVYDHLLHRVERGRSWRNGAPEPTPGVLEGARVTRVTTRWTVP